MSRPGTFGLSVAVSIIIGATIVAVAPLILLACGIGLVVSGIMASPRSK